MYRAGRRRKIVPQNVLKDAPIPMRAVNAVAAVGAAVCVLFFCAAVSGERETPVYPAERSEAAVAVFWEEHAAFADAIGLDAYFPKSAVQAGTFSSRGEEAYRDFLNDSTTKWTFGAYLRDAFRALLEQQ